jgi:hypothetical protein
MFLTISGWVVLAVLGMVLVRQMRITRTFSRPEGQVPPSLPAARVMIAADSDLNSLRRCLTSLAAQRYPGALEVTVLPAHSSPDDLQVLTLISDRIRIGDHETANDAVTVHLSPTTELVPEAIGALVHHALEERAAAATLLPRPVMKGVADAMLVPLAHFFTLTFFPRAKASCLLQTAEEGETVLIDGANLITEHRPPRRPFDALPLRGAARVAFGAGMLLLFSVTPLVALATGEFPWIVAAVTGLWLRLRTTVRTGEPLGYALLHPVAVAAAVLARPGRRADVGD